MILDVKVWRSREPVKSTGRAEIRVYVHVFRGEWDHIQPIIHEGCRYITGNDRGKARSQVEGDLTVEEWQAARKLAFDPDHKVWTRDAYPVARDFLDTLTAERNTYASQVTLAACAAAKVENPGIDTNEVFRMAQAAAHYDFDDAHHAQFAQPLPSAPPPLPAPPAPPRPSVGILVGDAAIGSFVSRSSPTRDETISAEVFIVIDRFFKHIDPEDGQDMFGSGWRMVIAEPTDEERATADYQAAIEAAQAEADDERRERDRIRDAQRRERTAEAAFRAVWDADPAHQAAAAADRRRLQERDARCAMFLAAGIVARHTEAHNALAMMDRLPTCAAKVAAWQAELDARWTAEQQAEFVEQFIAAEVQRTDTKPPPEILDALFGDDD